MGKLLGCLLHIALGSQSHDILKLLAAARLKQLHQLPSGIAFSKAHGIIYGKITIIFVHFVASCQNACYNSIILDQYYYMQLQNRW